MTRKNKIVIHEETNQIVIFNLGEEEFGVDILQVREIDRIEQRITAVPNIPDFIEGVINLRGEIIPIIDLRKRIGLVIRAIDIEARVIIIEVSGNLIGVIVDSVVEVIRVNISAIETVPSITKGVEAYFLNGVAKIEERLIILLDLKHILSDDEINNLNQIQIEVGA